MQFLLILKNFFKSLKSNLLMNFIYFLVLPIGLLIFMSSVTSMEFRNPIIIEASPISITDNDNSSASSDLINFIETNLKDLFEIKKDNNDADLEVVIPKGYEDSIVNNKSISIDLNVLSTRGTLDTLMKNILDEYHESIFINKLSSSSNLQNLFTKSSLTTTFIEPFNIQKPTEYFAVTMLGFLAINFMLNNVVVNYLGDSNGLNKRSYSMPVKRTTLLVYNSIILWLYSFLFLILYVLASRILNFAFYDSFPSLILICSITSLFISCSSNFISIFFHKTVGQIIVNVLLIVQMIAGGVFMPIENEFIMKLSPLYFITDLFNNYNNLSYSSLSIVICLVICFILFLASFLKEKYSWREF